MFGGGVWTGTMRGEGGAFSGTGTGSPVIVINKRDHTQTKENK